MTDKQILKRLRIEFFAYVVLAGLLILLYETHVFYEGGLVGNVSGTYMAECAGILLAVALIPLALKSFHKALLRMAGMDDDAARRRLYVKWNEIRLSMFLVVVLLNLSIYYTTVENICGYCALIGAIASLFCWPTKEGVTIELSMTPESDPVPAAESADAAVASAEPAEADTEKEPVAAESAASEANSETVESR